MDLFKPKSDDEIEKLILNHSPEQLIRIGHNINNINLIKIGIEKCNTKIFIKNESDFSKGNIEYFKWNDLWQNSVRRIR